MSFRTRLIGGIVALALVVTTVNFGLWQLRRHTERQRLNDRVESRMDLETVGIGDLYEDAALNGGGLLRGESGLRNAEYRRVSDIGYFTCEQEVLIRNRTLDGRPGYWVLTPFTVLPEGWDSADDASLDDLEGQQSYIVNRGWLPLELAEAYTFENTASTAGFDPEPAGSDPAGSDLNSDPSELPTPEELLASLPLPNPPDPNPCNTTGVEITGLISLPRSGAAKECESLAPVCTFANPDAAAIASHLVSVSSPNSLRSVNSDFYIQLENAEPLPEDIPVLLAVPSFDAGNHLSYAVQWFIFSTIAAVGYFLIFWGKGNLWKRRKSESREVSDF